MKFQFVRSSIPVLAVLLPLSLSVGCHQPLALQDSYFAPGNSNSAQLRRDALQALRYNRALQSARRSCPVTALPAVDAPGGSDRGAVRRAALGRVCAEAPSPTVAARGGTENAYRRWIEDRVRELPDASATAAAAAGGS